MKLEEEYKLYSLPFESYEDFELRWKQELIEANKEINELEQGMEEYYER